MKKVFFFLLLAYCSTIAFGINASEKNKKNESLHGKLIARLQVNSIDRFNELSMNALSKITSKNVSKKEFSKFDFLKSAIEKTDEQPYKRLDSCIVKDIDGKIFAKDYYFYYGYNEYPEKALKSTEVWQLNEETDEWNSFRMSATYDEFRNANNRFTEIYHDGVWTPEAKYTATYTAYEGELLLDMVEMYDVEKKEWYGGSKRTQTFDQQNRKLSTANYVWDQDAKNWVDDEKAEYTYESNKATELGYKWNGSAWASVSKLETNTDQNGNTISVINSEWNAEKNDWEITWKTENTYDSKGNLTNTTNYSINDDNVLVKTTQTVCTYGENTKETEDYNYNAETNGWDGAYKTKEVYANDLIIENFSYTWNEANRSWTNENRGVHQYSNNGSPILTNMYYWDGNEWKDDTKTAIEYDEYGYANHTISHYYDDSTTEKWVKDSELFEEYTPLGKPLKMEGYKLDDYGDWSGFGYKELYEYDSDGNEKTYSTYAWENGAWKLDEWDDFFYTLVTSDIKETTNNATNVKVSGSEGKIIIANAEKESIHIYSASGSLVYQISTANNNENIPMYNKGFYIVRVGEQSFKVNVR